MPWSLPGNWLEFQAGPGSNARRSILATYLSFLNRACRIFRRALPGFKALIPPFSRALSTAGLVGDMASLELVYDYFEDHMRAASLVNERQPLALGVLGFLAGALSLFLAQALTHHLFFLSFSWSSCVLMFLWELLSGFLWTGVLHLILEMGSIKGSAAGLFVLLGLADLSWALALALALLASLLMTRSSWISTGIFPLVWLLRLSLKARALQDNYHISSGRAWLTLSLPYAVATSAGLLVLFLVTTGFLTKFVSFN